jgi:hypothetical protein
VIWPPVTSFYFQKLIEAKSTPVWSHWEDAGRIAESALHSDGKGLPGSVPKTDMTVGPVSTCGRELLRGRWCPMGLMVSFMIFTASVRNILENTSYISRYKMWIRAEMCRYLHVSFPCLITRRLVPTWMYRRHYAYVYSSPKALSMKSPF